MATLVTGAFGCIGAWVCKRLLEAGERPVAFDVGEHTIDRIIHLAAWPVPLCRQDPSRGALIKVAGTANVFEAAKTHRDRVSRVTYFSSAGVFGPPHLYGPGPVTDDSPPKPATHYGVYKVANEEMARIYWEEHKIPSMGFRPLTVYGPGRDFGLTADPTPAMKSAVLGRPFEIRWGGATDFIYADNVARVYKLPGESAKVGPAPRTGIKDGIGRTLDEFAALQKAGRLDARELEPQK